MPYKFRSTVSRGTDKGKPMEEHKDADGNYVLHNPAKRCDGGVRAKDCTYTQSAEVAKKLISERGYSMRMRPVGVRAGSANLIKADRIVIIDLTAPESQ